MSARILAMSQHFVILQINERIKILLPENKQVEMELERFNSLSNDELINLIKLHL